MKFIENEKDSLLSVDSYLYDKVILDVEDQFFQPWNIYPKKKIPIKSVDTVWKFNPT
jgi:hypothetical protein